MYVRMYHQKSTLYIYISFTNLTKTSKSYSYHHASYMSLPNNPDILCCVITWLPILYNWPLHLYAWGVDRRDGLGDILAQSQV